MGGNLPQKLGCKIVLRSNQSVLLRISQKPVAPENFRVNSDVGNFRGYQFGYEHFFDISPNFGGNSPRSSECHTELQGVRIVLPQIYQKPTVRQNFRDKLDVGNFLSYQFGHDTFLDISPHFRDIRQ